MCSYGRNIDDTHGQRVVNMWSTPGHNMWSTPDQHVVNMWSTPDQHVVNTRVVAAVAQPPTSLVIPHTPPRVVLYSRRRRPVLEPAPEAEWDPEEAPVLEVMVCVAVKVLALALPPTPAVAPLWAPAPACEDGGGGRPGFRVKWGLAM